MATIKPGPEIRRLLLVGHSISSICKTLNVASASVCHHRRKLGLPKVPGGARKDWNAVQTAIDSGMTALDARRRFTISRSTWYFAVKVGKIKIQIRPRNLYVPLAEFSKANMGVATRRVRYYLKEKMIKEGVPYRCDLCGLTNWRGERIDLRLDHIDGDAGNNALHNLRLICPNCDSQLPTFSHRNIGRKTSVVLRDDGHLWKKGR
jgi:hypothetical protein